MAQGTARSLDIQPGARQNGLGSAGVALVGDPSDAVWWNPAALGFADRTSFQLTYAHLLPDLADIPFRHVVAAAPLGQWGGFGTSYTYLDYGDFYGSESSPSIALGVRVHPMVAVGARLKWVEVDLGGGLTGSTFTSDIGALAQMDQGPWTFGLGAMYQNMGGRVDFDFGGSAAPSRNYKMGASASVPVRLADDAMLRGTAVIDYNHSQVTDDFRTWNGGIEWALMAAHVVRMAARTGYYYDKAGNIRDFTIGGGVQLWMVSFDVARIPQARDSGLDPVVKFTLGVQADLSGPRPRWAVE